jgi:hypothetical protein
MYQFKVALKFQSEVVFVFFALGMMAGRRYLELHVSASCALPPTGTSPSHLVTRNDGFFMPQFRTG